MIASTVRVALWVLLSGAVGLACPGFRSGQDSSDSGTSADASSDESAVSPGPDGRAPTPDGSAYDSGDGSADDSGDASAYDSGDASTHDSGYGETDSASSEDAAACGFCNTPPAATCTSGMLTYYSAVGICSSGSCDYAPTTVACANGCGNGACNGSGWTTMNSNTTVTLFAVWGSSASDVWVVGDEGVAEHYDGTGWTVISPPGAGTLTAVAGSGPNDVYAAGTDIWHWNGASWTLVPALAPPATQGLALDAPMQGSLWVSGFQGVSADTVALYASNGATLGSPETASTTYVNTSFTPQAAVLALSPTNIWVGGNPITHSDGTALTTYPSVQGLSFWAASDNAVFATTGASSVEIRNGSTWTSSNTGTTYGTSGVWGTSSSRVFVATGGEEDGTAGEVRSYNGLGWTNETLPQNTLGLTGVYAAPSGQVFAVGLGGTILIGP